MADFVDGFLAVHAHEEAVGEVGDQAVLGADVAVAVDYASRDDDGGGVVFTHDEAHAVVVGGGVGSVVPEDDEEVGWT